MPNPQNRNDRRKGEERSETLIIPHITKEITKNIKYGITNISTLFANITAKRLSIVTGTLKYISTFFLL